MGQKNKRKLSTFRLLTGMYGVRALLADVSTVPNLSFSFEKKAYSTESTSVDRKSIETPKRLRAHKTSRLSVYFEDLF